MNRSVSNATPEYTPHESLYHLLTTKQLLEKVEGIDKHVLTCEAITMTDDYIIRAQYRRVQKTANGEWLEQWEAVAVEVTSAKNGNYIKAWSLSSDINYYRFHSQRRDTNSGERSGRSDHGTFDRNYGNRSQVSEYRQERSSYARNC